LLCKDSNKFPEERAGIIFPPADSFLFCQVLYITVINSAHVCREVKPKPDPADEEEENNGVDSQDVAQENLGKCQF
jgi:hypothetical protein